MRRTALLTMHSIWRLALLAVAVVLLIAGIIKLLDMQQFHETIASHSLIPHPLVPFAAWGVTALEVLIACFVISSAAGGRTLRSASILAAILFLAFAVYAVLLVINPPATPTGCGCLAGNAPVEDWMPIALRNAIASLALFIPLALPRTLSNRDASPDLPLPTADYPA